MSTQPNKTRVQVATDAAFTNIVADKNGGYGTSVHFSKGDLPTATNLYLRGMHGHPETGDSTWTSTIQFTIKAMWIDWNGSANGIATTLSNAYGYQKIVPLSNGKFITIGGYDSSKTSLSLKLISLVGTTISIDHQLTKSVGATSVIDYGSFSAVELADNKLALFHVENNTTITYTIYNFSTGSLVFENTNTLSITAAIASNRLCAIIRVFKLSDGNVICFYANNADYKIMGVKLTLNSNAFTAGSPVALTPNTDKRDQIFDIIPTGTDKFAVAYKETPQIYTQTGSTVTYGAKLCTRLNAQLILRLYSTGTNIATKLIDYNLGHSTPAGGTSCPLGYNTTLYLYAGDYITSANISTWQTHWPTITFTIGERYSVYRSRAKCCDGYSWFCSTVGKTVKDQLEVITTPVYGYIDGDTSIYCTIVTVSGSTITSTAPSSSMFTSSYRRYGVFNIVEISNTKFIMFDENTYGFFKIITINGDNTISVSTSTTFCSDAVKSTVAKLVSSDKLLIVYVKYANSVYSVCGKIYTSSDGFVTLTAGNEIIIKAGTSYQPTLSAIDDALASNLGKSALLLASYSSTDKSVMTQAIVS